MRHPSSSESTKRVGIWIRVSTEDQAKGESPEHHEQRARFYAQAKGWIVNEVYHLEAVSGKSVMDQPETKRMLKHIESGHITGLIFSKLARLARNTKELLEFADIFRDHQADLISLGESIDTSTPAGRLFYTIIAAMAQWEREEISARVAASVPIRGKLGKCTGGQAPFGYRWENNQLVIDPKEAPIRKLMFELFVQHKRKKAVARLLNEAGHRTRAGAKFRDNSVHRLLTDPIAKGLRRANYTKSLGDKMHWVLKPESEWVYSEVEPIVSEELWENCNRILSGMKNGKRPGKKPVQLFGSVTYCHCGRKMYKPSNSPNYYCHGCHNKIPVNDLETLFHEQLKGFIFSETEVEKLLTETDETVREKEELLLTLEREHQRVESEANKLLDLYLAGEIPKEGFGRKYQPLEERLRQIANQIPELQGEIDFLKIQNYSSDQVIAEARDFYSKWDDLSIEEKRQVVENITEKIIIGTNDVTIQLCYLPSSSIIPSNSLHNHTG